MFKLLKYLIGLIVFCGVTVFAITKVYESKINDEIVNSENKLRKYGIETTNVSSNDTLLSVNRSYMVVIDDSTYILQRMDPTVSTDNIKKSKEILDKTSALIQMSIPKYPSKKNNAVIITLDELSPVLNKELASSNLGRQLLVAIKDNLLQVNMDINSQKITKASIKDIDLTLSEKDIKFSCKLVDSFVNIENMSNFESYLDKLMIKLSSHNQSFEFNINSYAGTLKRTDSFTQSDKLKVGNISLNFTDLSNYSGFKFKLDAIEGDSNIYTKEGGLVGEMNMDISNIYINDIGRTLVDVKDFKTKMKLTGLNKERLIKLEKEFNGGKNYSQEEFKQIANAFLNDGFSMSIEKLELGKGNLSIKDKDFNFNTINLKSDMILKKNNLDLETLDKQDFGSLISTNVILDLRKKDVLAVMQKFRLPLQFYQFVKIENEDATIHAKFENQRLTVNGIPLQ